MTYKQAKHKIRNFFRLLGPGLVTGAADDDPSGIATYSQAGAQYGFGLLWTSLFMLPLQVSIQEACARIGAVTGKGIALVIKEHYGKRILYFVVSLLLIANTINIGADIGAMAAATQLLIPIDFVILCFTFSLLMITLTIYLSYKTYAKVLKWLCLSLLAYPLTVIIVNEDWLLILKATFIPHFEWSFDFLFMLVAVLGTTISPYLFFWQASQEVEEKQGKPITQTYIRKLRIDNFTGMFSSEFATWAIIVVGATVLHSHGITNINTAADAAKAIEPLVQNFPHAGTLAKIIFATGIIGLGLISVPVLAASAAYALCETFNHAEGLSLKLKEGRFFYGIIVTSTFVGLALNFIGIDPIKALIYSAVINGIIAVPLIFVIGLIAKNKLIMGNYASGKLSHYLVAITFICMLLASLAMLTTL